jgi:glycerate kinase
MRVVVAPDSFKGSLKSPQVAEAMAAGVRAAAPGAEVTLLPVGDGGEGTLEALVAATHGSWETHRVMGPLGEPVEARLGLLGDGETVFVEMAEASGLSRVPPGRLSPREATTYGTGELLLAALRTGRPRVLVGIGGSATSDGGAGLLQALGARLLNGAGRELARGGGALAHLERIDLSGLKWPADRTLTVACDVTNPLTGPTGAAAVYGPQKGATPADVLALDAALARFAQVTFDTLGRDLHAQPGAGAAGGLGFALLAYLNARLERGADLVLDAAGFDRMVAGADLVLTGEGRIDLQTTAYGKTLAAIGRRAQAPGVPVLALGGSLGADLTGYRETGITGVGAITPGPMTLEEAMGQAPRLIREAAQRLVEVFLARP